jgi:hypothetical protein
MASTSRAESRKYPRSCIARTFSICQTRSQPAKRRDRQIVVDDAEGAAVDGQGATRMAAGGRRSRLAPTSGGAGSAQTAPRTSHVARLPSISQDSTQTSASTRSGLFGSVSGSHCVIWFSSLPSGAERRGGPCPARRARRSARRGSACRARRAPRGSEIRHRPQARRLLSTRSPPLFTSAITRSASWRGSSAATAFAHVGASGCRRRPRTRRRAARARPCTSTPPRRPPRCRSRCWSRPR